MNIDKVHTPERLEGETQLEYAARRRMSTRLQERTKLICGPKTRYAAPAAKLARRTLVKSIGIRQAKKALRKAKEAQHAPS